ncbi:hypothetical protein [Sagittula stellata]|uniref:hypothetical protein n=1 Tax=Sagittula stellata TaxID=52603 RepID=UPI0012F4B2BB|nr:hypothetical protein [Sagittula stellata]
MSEDIVLTLAAAKPAEQTAEGSAQKTEQTTRLTNPGHQIGNLDPEPFKSRECW